MDGGSPLAVTGSTGALGGLVARGLAAHGVPNGCWCGGRRRRRRWTVLSSCRAAMATLTRRLPLSTG